MTDTTKTQKRHLYYLKSVEVMVIERCTSIILMLFILQNATPEQFDARVLQLNRFVKGCPKITMRSGDLTAFAGPLAHCVSTDLHMGAGVAKAINLARPYNRPKNWGAPGVTKSAQANLINTVLVCENPVNPADKVFNLITKLRYFDSGDYRNMEIVLQELRVQLETHQIGKLAMPKVGCGRDHLEWEKVLELIKKVFKGCVVEIDIFELP